VFGFNFTKLDILRSRSFAVSTRDRRALAEAARLFEADATRQEYKPANSNLIVSPETSRSALTAFLKGTRGELAIYDARLNDAAMIKVLEGLAARGVRIRVIGALKRGCDGFEVRALEGMRLHVRAIVRDGMRVFVGSQSLSKEELDSRREVGLLVNNPTVARKVLQVFEQDWLEAAGSDAVREENQADAVA
jgi:phosphatidylserine/phosphatidylglycerophosphate/cardiolipin synthase-like enzyme